MTREDAIKILKSKMDGHTDTSYEWTETVRMAIKSLKQELCDDAVSRQAVNDLVDELARAISDERCCMSRGRSTATIMQDILDLQSVTPQPKIGRWIVKEGKEQGYDIAGIKTWYVQIMCNQCGFIKTAIEGHTGQYKYCSQCGANMHPQS